MQPYDDPIRDDSERVSPFIPMSIGELLRVGAVGAVVGLVTSGLMYLFTVFVFGALLCRNQSSECPSAPFYSMVIAMILGALVGLAVLARQRVYRPLLVVVAATVSLWMFHVIIAGIVWWVALLASMIMFALTYMFFAWIARIRAFLIALILLIIAIVIMRLVLR